METYNVTFHPDGVTVEAARGKSLLEVATAAGVAVTAVCGGDGVCGKCRVIVKSGKVTAKPNIFLGRLDIQRGVALACQTYVDGDVVVEVPLESRVGGVPQLASEDAIRYGRVSELVGEAAAFPHNSLARKEYLDLPVPGQDDNTSDQERIFAALRGKREIPIMQMGLSVLRDVASVIRSSNWQVTALLGHRGGTVEVMEVCSGDTSGRNYGVAVDLGTTTVVAHLVDLNSSETLATKAKYNSQVSFGDDVIARMMYATTGERRRQLRDTLVSDVNDLIAALVSDARVKLQDVNFVICAGNTTMTHFLYGLRPEHIRKDPYVPSMSYPPTVRAAEVGVTISARGLLAALPSVASYVGGDVIGDVLVTGMTESEEVSLLIDMGTNGELVLGNSDWMVCCSASAGPAFEGGGISCGMRATNGAIEHIELDERGRVKKVGVVGGGKPLGVCGSGIIDAVGELLRTGCIDRRGRFMADKCGSLVRKAESGDKEFVLFHGKDTALGRDIIVSEADISNLIHTKGSIFMAVECLLDHVGLEFDDIKHVYIAGGFGNYLQVEQAIGIGLLPDLDPGIFQCIGNGSVQGAKMALLSVEAHEYIKDRIAACMTYLELSTYHKYMNEYSSTLFLPHTDIEKFPSLMAMSEAV
jgi:uncharacterized 2Fe-2S/4Fe-4S cluster protein (DUF4445 family)